MGLDIFRNHIIRVEDRKYRNYSKTSANMAYLRSSYNEEGFNSVCRANGLPDMYKIFSAAHGYDIDSSDYFVQLYRENLPEAVDLALETKRGLLLISDIDSYYIETIDVIIAMLEEMLNTGYGLLLEWSA